MEALWRYFLCCGIVAILILPDIALCCPGSFPKLGNMTKDYNLEVGKLLTVQCTIFSNNININDMVYYLTSENLEMKFGDTFLQNLTKIDDFTIEYTKDNATVDDTGIYNCFLSIPKLENKTFVCTTYIAVGYPPLPVNKFSCIGNSFQSINCSWEKPFNPVATNYTLTDYLYGIKLYSRPCPIPKVNSCVYSLDAKSPYIKTAKTIYFSLTGNNSLGINSQYIEIDHYKIVKPAQPSKMMFTQITRHSVMVNWSSPRGMEYNDFPPGLDYWLYYCPSNDNCTDLCGIVKQENITESLVTGLVPSIEYTFKVRCRSRSADSEDMWSPFLIASVKTESDVPYLVPETISSSFEVQNVQANRTITLFWKAIPSCHENGDGFKYIIQYNHYIRPRQKREYLQVEVGNKTSYTFTHMDSDSAYFFRIFAQNNVGISDNSSFIIVDKADNLIPQPSDISVLSSGNGMYTLSWADNSDAAVENFTLFWCENIKPRPFRCEGALNWLTVIGAYQELTLSDSKTNYQFAVASNAAHSTSGLAWASCIVPVHGVLYKVNDIYLTSENATSIRVNWMLDCNAQKSVVLEYVVSFCAVHADLNCYGKMNTTYIENPHQEQYIVTGLYPFTTYQFTVAARTEYGWSENSWIKYETTKPSAPSDAPHQVRMLSINGTVIKISFRPPRHPNGDITKYVVSYSTRKIKREKIEYKVTKTAGVYEAEINHPEILLYTNYTIEVEACVFLGTGLMPACSPYSYPVYAFTGIGVPGPIARPNAEVINSTFVNVTWEPPRLPNGPIDMYQLTVLWRDYENYELTDSEYQKDIFNVSGHQTHMTISVECPPQLKDSVAYYFSVQAINVIDNVAMYGLSSEPDSTQMCHITAAGMPYRLLVGMIVGIALGLTILVLAIYALAKWMKKKVDMVKSITVQLPTGLDSPTENPLSTYHNFKNGLQQNNLDSGIPSDRVYDHLGRYAADKMTKDIAKALDVVSEDFLKRGREKTGRNQSGDSNASGKGHDSISSSTTNKTHLSIDSGTEIDMPPSPDGMFSDTSSSNTTPRSYKPDLEIVEENNASGSKDSGLEKESINHMLPVLNGTNLIEPSSRYPYYIRKKGHPYFNVQPTKRNEQMQPYSKFAIVAPVFTSNYVSVGVHNPHLLQQQSLANSEPSVAEFQDDSDSEPLMVSGVPPYCRFGLARSAGNGLNIANPYLPVQESLGYSKFGIIYSALGKPSSTCHNNSCAPNYSRVACSRAIPNFNNNLVFLKHPLITNKKPLSAVEEKASPTSVSPNPIDSFLLSNDLDVTTGLLSADSVSKPPVSSNYVSYNQVLADSCNQNSQFNSPPANQCDYEDFDEDLDEVKFEIVLSPEEKKLPELIPPCTTHSNPSSYVSFQDAKVMSQNDHLPECHNSTQDGDDSVSFPATNQVADNFAQSSNGNTENTIECPTESKTSILDLFHLPNPESECKSVPLSVNGDTLKGDDTSENPEPSFVLPEKLFGLDSLESTDASHHAETFEDEILDPEVDFSFSPTANGTSQPSICKPYSASNGYVTWNELLGTKTVDVSILPSGTNTSNIEHV